MKYYDRDMQELENAIKKVDQSPLFKSLLKQKSVPLKKTVRETMLSPIAKSSLVAAAEKHQLAKSRYQQLSGIERVALQKGLRLDYPGLKAMSVEEIEKAAALESAESVRHIARRCGTEHLLDLRIAEIRSR